VINLNAFHLGEIDDESLITDGTTAETVPTTADSRQQVILTSEQNSLHHIIHIATAGERYWISVNPAVPDPACPVVILFAWKDESAMQPGLETLHR
jgi:hypothetical protein